MIPLGAFGMGTGVARLALGVAALSVLEVFVCVCGGGDWFPPVMSVADKFLVFTHCFVGLLAGGDWFQCAFALSVWVVWLFCGWPELSGGNLGCFLGSLCLVLCGRLLPSMLAGTDG